MASAGGAEWIGVRVGLRGADLVLCRGGATQVISRSLGSKAGAGGYRGMMWPLMPRHSLATEATQPPPGQQSGWGRGPARVALAGSGL